MRQEIKNNIYFLFDDDEKILLKITLSDMPGNQIIIETDNEVFAGPIKFLKFTDNTPKWRN